MTNNLPGLKNATLTPFDDTNTNLGVTTTQQAIEAVVEIANNSPPSDSIFLDGTGGSDINDGFSAPVQTAARLLEIINFYNWGGAAIEVNVINVTTPWVLTGLNPVGAAGIYFNSDNNPFTTLFIIFACTVPIRFRSFSFEGNSSLFFINIPSVEFSTGISFEDMTSSPVITTNKVFDLLLNSPSLQGTFDGVFVNTIATPYVSYNSGSFNSLNLTELLALEGTQTLTLSNGSGALTGKVINIVESPSITVVNNSWAVTGTVADTYPESYTLNGEFFPLVKITEYFDVSRNQNLGATAAQDLRRAGNVPTNQSPFYPKFVGTINSVTLSQENLTDWNLEIYKNGILETTVSKNNGASVFNASLNISVVPTDAIRLRYAGATATTNRPTATISVLED